MLSKTKSIFGDDKFDLRILLTRVWLTSVSWRRKDKTGTPCLPKAIRSFYKWTYESAFWAFVLNSSINLLILPLFLSTCFMKAFRASSYSDLLKKVKIFM